MPRPRPETVATGLALVRWIADPCRELPVGDAFSDDGDNPYSDCSDSPGSHRTDRIRRSGQQRQREQRHDHCLRLEEQEELALMSLPVFSQMVVSAVLGMFVHARMQMQRQSQRPQRDHRADQAAHHDRAVAADSDRDRHQSHQGRPCDVHIADVAGSACIRPYACHRERASQPDPQQQAPRNDAGSPCICERHGRSARVRCSCG